MEKISGAFSFYLPFISSDPVLYTEKGSENCIEVSKSRMSNSDISFETLHSFPIDFTPKEYSDFVKGNYKKISTSTIDTINSSLKMKASDSYFFPIYMLIFIIWSNFILLFKKIINFFE
jgi:hypothetical protein